MRNVPEGVGRDKMITNEMVLAAWNAFDHDRQDHDGMRAALEAAFAVRKLPK